MLVVREALVFIATLADTKGVFFLLSKSLPKERTKEGSIFVVRSIFWDDKDAKVTCVSMLSSNRIVKWRNEGYGR